MLYFSVFFFLCFLEHFRPTSGGVVGMPGGDMAKSYSRRVNAERQKFLKKAKRGLT
jgi:hypothetical protein